MMNTVEILLNVKHYSEVFPAHLPEWERDQKFKQLRIQVHPDRNIGNEANAQKAWNRLMEMYQQAQGVPSASSIVLNTSMGEVSFSEARWRDGEVSWLDGSIPGRIPGRVGDVTVFGVVARGIPRALLSDGFGRLRTIRDRIPAEYRGFVPTPVECVTVQAATSEKELHVVTVPHGEFVTLADIHRLLPGGLDGRDVVWILKRLLVALGNVHDAKFVYNSVSAESVLVEVVKHGLVLKDWHHVTAPGGLLPIPNAGTEKLRGYTQAVLDKKESPVAKADLAAAGRLMLDVASADLPEPLKVFLKGSNSWGSARDAIQGLDAAAFKAYGKPRFHEMVLPS